MLKKVHMGANMDLAFSGACISRLGPLTSVVNGIAWCSDCSSPHG